MRIVKVTATIAIICASATIGALKQIEAIASIAPHTTATQRAHHSRAVWVAERRHAAALRRTRLTLRRRAIEVGEWTHIAVCEEGGWIGYAGPAFPDSLGITASNWWSDGGGSDLRPFVQAKVAERIMDPAPASCPW